jgi:hypothetical protein
MTTERPVRVGAVSAARDVLAIALQASVPLCIAELGRLHGASRDRTFEAWRVQAADGVAARGDSLQFRDKHTATAFTNLARGIAVLAHAPGGVGAFGVRWCALHHAYGAHDDGLPCAECAGAP